MSADVKTSVHDFGGVLESAIDHLRRVGSAQFDDTLVLGYVDRSDENGPAVGITLDGAQDTEPFHVWLDETFTGVLVLIRVIMPTPSYLVERGVEPGATFRDDMDSLSDPTGRQATTQRNTPVNTSTLPAFVLDPTGTQALVIANVVAILEATELDVETMFHLASALGVGPADLLCPMPGFVSTPEVTTVRGWVQQADEGTTESTNGASN